jgi:hypothetical protein
MKEYLTDLEIVKIETFVSDKDMFEAVKKVLLQHIYEQGVPKAGFPHNPLKNRAFMLVQHATDNPMTDEVLGQHIRGVWEGVNALEKGYEELQNIKSKKEDVETPYNEAI